MPWPNGTSNVKYSVRYATIWTSLLAGLLAGTAAVAAPDFVLVSEPQQVERIYLEQRIAKWLEAHPEAEAGALQHYLQDLYLQWGYPAASVQAHHSAGSWQIQIAERQTQDVQIATVRVTGGTPHMRYITRQNLHQQSGQIFNRQRLLAAMDWIYHNHFIPLELQLKQTVPEQVELHLHIVGGAEWIPTGNLALNEVVGLAITAGVIADNPFGQGNIFRAMGKRNNIPTLGMTPAYEVQDWEYILSWSTTALPWEGLNVGVNHYNKVDYIYPFFGEQNQDLIWIRSIGADLYAGFPIWDDSEQRRYLRGVANLTLLEDHFFASSGSTTEPTGLSSSGQAADLLLMPGLTVSYSDIDDYRIPRNGHFIQGRLNGGLLDARFVQATLTGFSVWTPWQHEGHQLSILVRSAAGSTFGNNPPFYRGFLNTGNWLVRGATQFSITEKHSLRLSEEFHYLYTPTALELEQFSQLMFGGPGLSALDGWAFDLNVFLDQGAYWRDSWDLRSPQFSIGIGINAITPFGNILGVDLAQPVWPGGGLSALLRISAPLSFTLYSDWINSNGFFLR